jgi:hypothetical protein
MGGGGGGGVWYLVILLFVCGCVPNKPHQNNNEAVSFFLLI